MNNNTRTLAPHLRPILRLLLDVDSWLASSATAADYAAHLKSAFRTHLHSVPSPVALQQMAEKITRDYPHLLPAEMEHVFSLALAGYYTEITASYITRQCGALPVFDFGTMLRSYATHRRAVTDYIGLPETGRLMPLADDTEEVADGVRLYRAQCEAHEAAKARWAQLLALEEVTVADLYEGDFMTLQNEGFISFDNLSSDERAQIRSQCRFMDEMEANGIITAVRNSKMKAQQKQASDRARLAVAQRLRPRPAPVAEAA